MENQIFYLVNKLMALSTVPTANDRDLRVRAHQICSEHLGGAWCEISPNEMSFSPVSGGMSNQLFCCSLPESIEAFSSEPSRVLLRLYGDQSRNSDMSVQVEIFKLLSNKELGPKLYANFDDGRLEEFLPAQSLTSDELMNRDISNIIARKLSAIHSLDVPIKKDNSWLLDRFNDWRQFIIEQPKEPNFQDGVGQSTKVIARELMAIDFGEEIKFLRAIFNQTRSPIVFSHNDLHQGNILLVKHSKRRSSLDKRVILIDFEYCSYNYRAYDIANHFCEWCFEYDTPDYPHFKFFEDRFPSKEIQREFVRHYMEQQKHNSAVPKPPTSILAPNVYLNNGHGCERRPSNGLSNGNGVSGHPANGNGVLAKQLKDEDQLLEEVKPFFMAASLLWTIWCIKSAHSSNIKFGYWEHAMTRWRLYRNFKSLYLKEMKTKEARNGRCIV